MKRAKRNSILANVSAAVLAITVSGCTAGSGSKVQGKATRPAVASPGGVACFKPVFSDGQMIVAAVVATEAPYHADSTGKTDASAAIQKALSDTVQRGGGTVFLPAGRYRIDHSISVPHSVTLCGEWRKPVPGKPLQGTILLAYADKGNAAGPALLTSPSLGHANFFSLTIIYPEQDPANPIPYPFTIDGKVSYVHDITLVNSYQGIMMSDFSGSSVSGIYGTVLKRGIVLKSSTELCSCYNVRLSSDYWTKLPEACMTPESAANVRRFVANELVAVQIGKVDGLSFYNADLSEAKTPVVVKLESDEEKVMATSRSQYGFGGGLCKVKGQRKDIEGGWYFGTHYFDLDNYPQLSERCYTFTESRQAGKAGPGTVYQAAEFGVKADGASDDSAALQQALGAAGEAGGGTVLLPHGRIVLKAPLDIPAGVELRGGYLGAPVRAWFNTISTLIIDCDADTSDPENARAAISLRARAGLRGIDVCQAKNLWELDAAGKLVIHSYPYAIRGLGAGVYVRDVILPNVYNGVDLGQARCDRAQVVNLWGTMYHHGIRVGAKSDAVQIENVSIDIGPLCSDYRLMTQLPASSGKDKRAVLQGYLDENAVTFLFGDCTRLTTFHAAGFAPHRFMEFFDQGHGGCRDAQFWSSVFDVPNVETVRFSGGGRIGFYGLFTTGGGNRHSLWAEFDEAFKGKVDVFGLCQQLTFNNRPFTVGPDKLQIRLEHSLTTGRPATASSSAMRSKPTYALDGDARTLWQTQEGAGPHVLTVELAAPSVITRWRVHNAGTFLGRSLNTAAAELHVSKDGREYFKVAEFSANLQDWVDLPVKGEIAARFVQLRVIKGQAPGATANSARIAAFDVFGYPAAPRP